MPQQHGTSANEGDAATVEVTAKELVSAAAAVEARRDAGHRKDTIAIGDAIAQLGLSVTPEELAREVELQKQQREAAERLGRYRKGRWTRRLFGAALVLSLALNVKLLTSPPTPPTNHPPVEIFEQSGRFNAISGKDGLVRFPVPYSAVPNLELSLSPTFNKTVVTETMSWGFRWRNNGKDDLFNNSSISWKSRGRR